MKQELSPVLQGLLTELRHRVAIYRLKAHERLRKMGPRAKALLPEVDRRIRAEDDWDRAHAIVTRYFITREAADLEVAIKVLGHKNATPRAIALVGLQEAGPKLKERMKVLLGEGNAHQRTAAKSILHHWVVTDPAYRAAHLGQRKVPRTKPKGPPQRKVRTGVASVKKATTGTNATAASKSAKKKRPKRIGTKG